MHPTREKCKRKHYEGNTDLHEIIPWAWRRYGDKYGRAIKDPVMWGEVARLYFIPELTMLIPNAFNLGSADGARDTFLQMKMYEYGPDRIVSCLQALAETMKEPGNYLPHSIEFNGKVYQILLGDLHGSTD